MENTHISDFLPHNPVKHPEKPSHALHFTKTEKWGAKWGKISAFKQKSSPKTPFSPLSSPQSYRVESPNVSELL